MEVSGISGTRLRVSGVRPSVLDDRRARFELLFQEHYPRVLGYGLRRTSPQEAHDVAAETFLVAWRRLESIPPEPLPWLLSVARKTLANKKRSEGRRAALERRLRSEPSGVPGSDPADDVAATEGLLTALRELSEKDRETLLLVAWDGLGPNEAATVLGCSRSTFSVRLHRARRRLMKALERAGHTYQGDAADNHAGRPVQQGQGHPSMGDKT